MATYNFSETRPIGRPSGTMRILAVTVAGLAALEAALVGSGITLVVDRVVPNGTTLVSVTGGTGTCTIPWDFLGNAEEYQVQVDTVDVLDCSTFGALYRDVYAISDTVFPNVTSIATTGSGQYAPVVGGGVEFISGYGNIAPADPVATGDWALRYAANEMPALGDVSIVGDITGEFAFSYTTDEADAPEPIPPAECQFSVVAGSVGSTSVSMGLRASPTSDGFVTLVASTTEPRYFGVESGDTIIASASIAGVYPEQAASIPDGGVVSVAQLLSNINAGSVIATNVYCSVQNPIGGENYFTLQAEFSVDTLAGIPTPTPPTYPLTELVFAPNDMVITVIAAVSTTIAFEVPYVVPTITYAARAYTITADAIATDVGGGMCNGVTETQNTLIAVGGPSPFPAYASIIIPTGSVFDPTNFATQTFKDGAAQWALIYYSLSTGAGYVLSDPEGEDFGLPLWTGGEITMGATDMLGFLAIANTAGVSCSLGLSYSTSAVLNIKSPYFGNEAYCSNSLEPTPRKRSSTVHLNHVRFYMSYQYTPAGTNTLPPQESIVTLVGA